MQNRHPATESVHGDLRKVVDGIRLFGADVDDLVVRFRQIDAARHVRRNIVYIGESSCLLAIAKDGERPAAHDLAHEIPRTLRYGSPRFWCSP